jgi:hypothetical protein
VRPPSLTQEPLLLPGRATRVNVTGRRLGVVVRPLESRETRWPPV